MNLNHTELWGFRKSGGMLKEVEESTGEIEALRDRISGMSEAIVRITESLDLDTVLRGVIDSARSLTGARYGALLIFDDSGNIQNLMTSGITPEEVEAIQAKPMGLGILAYMNECHEPLRLRDIASHPMSVGFPKGHPRMETFLGTPIRHLDSHFGNIYLTEKEGRQEFTSEDEHTLVLFASQAAMVIANARRYMEEHQAKANLEALVSTSPVGVLVFDAKTLDVASLNQETRRIVGGMNGAGRSLPHPLKVMTFRRPDGREFSPDELPPLRALRNGETARAEEVVIQLPDGQSVTTLVNSTPIFSEDDEITSVVATLQDMTPLEELERIRSEFLSMVSQELRTPLTAIKGSATTVLSASSAMNDSEMRQFFQKVPYQAAHGVGLIRDLLGVTRIEAETLSIIPEPTALASLIEQARSGFLREGARNRIDMDLAPDLPRVRADRQRIVQVLNNLFSNASKYSPDGSAIRVSASAEDVYVSISVSDEGRGISAESLPRIFKKFSRLDSEYMDRHTEGDDLGLAICKGIVEAHGGRIWAESGGQGLGARLTFTIPAVEEAVNGPGPRPGRLAADSGPKAGPWTRIDPRSPAETGLGAGLLRRPAALTFLRQKASSQAE